VELGAAVTPSLARPISSEPKLVHAAESATTKYANNDVSRAVLRAQQQAKAQYQTMMASALKAEAKAHKVGQKATEQALAWQAKAEQSKIKQRRMRAQSCVPLPNCVYLFLSTCGCVVCVRACVTCACTGMHVFVRFDTHTPHTHTHTHVCVFVLPYNQQHFPTTQHPCCALLQLRRA